MPPLFPSVLLSYEDASPCLSSSFRRFLGLSLFRAPVNRSVIIAANVPRHGFPLSYGLCRTGLERPFQYDHDRRLLIPKHNEPAGVLFRVQEDSTIVFREWRVRDVKLGTWRPAPPRTLWCAGNRGTSSFPTRTIWRRTHQRPLRRKRLTIDRPAAHGTDRRNGRTRTARCSRESSRLPAYSRGWQRRGPLPNGSLDALPRTWNGSTLALHSFTWSLTLCRLACPAQEV